MSLYLATGSPETEFTPGELKQALFGLFDTLGPRRRVLCIPPDFTRFHSRAGELTRLAYEYYGDRLLAVLRERLARMDPASEQAREGYLLLGNVEARRRDWAAAADAWSHALAARFDPTLAAETAAAMYQRDGRLSAEAAALFRRALAEAPPDAPWRPMAEKRLAEEGRQ
jgi:hypothetical protein